MTLLRAVAGGAGSLAPVHAALGTVLDTVEPGHAVARVPRLPPHRLRGPGVVPVLGDLVLSAAITSSLAAGLRISTLTLHTAMLGPLPPPGAALVARSYLVAPAGTTAVSRAEVCAADGRPVAHLTARWAVLPSDGEGALFHDPLDPDPFAALGPELRAASRSPTRWAGCRAGCSPRSSGTGSRRLVPTRWRATTTSRSCGDAGRRRRRWPWTWRSGTAADGWSRPTPACTTPVAASPCSPRPRAGSTREVAVGRSEPTASRRTATASRESRRTVSRRESPR